MQKVQKGVFVEFDFQTPAHVSYVESCFGGELHMQERYPLLHAALQKARRGGFPPQSTPAGYVSRAHVHEVVLKAHTPEGAANDSSGKSVYSNGNITLTGKKPVVHITLEIFRDNDRIGRNFKTAYQVQSLDLDCEAPYQKMDADNIYAVISCFWNEPDSDILSGGYIFDKLEIDSGAYVSKTICDNPVKQKSKNPKKIVVSYGRKSSVSEDVDYWYAEGSRDKDGNQRVKLDVNGSVVLKTGYTFAGYIKHDLSMFSPTKGVIIYANSNPVCAETKDGFSWKFNTEWNDSIQSSVQYGQHLYDFDMRLEFQVRDCDNKLYNQNIDVSSVNTQDASNVFIIPELELLWGCLGKDTLISMADGTEKKISDVRTGDKVKTPDGSTEVINVWSGTAQDIYHIKADNDTTIFATEAHPFKSDQGFVIVQELTSDTRLLNSQGKTMRVLTCYSLPYNDNVYSLDLNNSDSFYANGFLSGTMSVQNDAAELCRNESLPEVSAGLKSEMNLLAQEITDDVIFRQDRFQNGKECVHGR